MKHAALLELVKLIDVTYWDDLDRELSAAFVFADIAGMNDVACKLDEARSDRVKAYEHAQRFVVHELGTYTQEVECQLGDAAALLETRLDHIIAFLVRQQAA